MKQYSQLFNQMSIRTKFALVFYSVILITLSIVAYYGYSNTAKAYQQKATGLVSDYTSEVSQKISDFLDLTRSDLGFFAENSDLYRYLYWQDLGVKEKEEGWREAVIDNWRGFSRSYDYLYKVRFIDLQGIEQITIRRDPTTRNVRSLNLDELQDKSNEAYFSDALALEQGKISVKQLDLNREYGKIEKPLVPVVRLSQPVYGENQAKFGVVVVNLFADAFFDYIRAANQRIENSSFYLINPEGEFLFHPDPAKSFAHLLGHGDNFRALFPSLLEQLNTQEEGVLFTQNHVIGFKRIFPHPSEQENYWILVGTIDEAQVFGELSKFKYWFFSLLAVVLLMVFFVSRYFLNTLLTPLSLITRQLERLGRGEVVREQSGYHSEDEIGQMLSSTESLVDTMEILTKQADTIAAGDFSGRVPVLSEQDRLGQALNNMTGMLRDNREQTQRQSWQRDGLAELSQQLSSEIMPEELADHAVSFTCRYLDAAHGVFYLYDQEQKKLQLLASYMFTERDRLHQQFELGEGAVGQVAREHKPILLRDIRVGEAAVTTGTLEATPFHTYTVPLLHEQLLYGVIELAVLRPFDPLMREFVDQAALIISTFLYSSLQRKRIQHLLADAEKATLGAQEQSCKLQDTNSLMKEQQQQLQQQTEELQQTNAQMEEQQQQLQQQTEELKQTNEQMTTQQKELQLKNKDLLLSQEELDNKAQQLEISSQYKSEFLANMSHELRTPLNSILLLSKMLAMNEQGHLNTEESKRAWVIHKAGDELLRLINDILDLSKIEAGKMELHLQGVNSTDFLDDFHEQFMDSAKERKLQYQIEDNWQGEFTTDRDKLAQIIRNLLSNAFKFTQQGSVKIRMTRSANPELPVSISVIDSGIGIPEEKQAIIFEAFQQVDGSISRAYGGTGLGLSISLSIAHLLGGSIELKSTAGQGSEFTVLLPENLIQTESLKPQGLQAEPIESIKLQAQVTDDRSNLSADDDIILIIDDDADFCDSVRAVNAKQGYKTLSALNAKEGLKMAKAYSPSGILLDLGLPDKDGNEVLRELKSTRDLDRIPVYVISGREKDSELLKQGIVGYLQKPVNDNQLAAAGATMLAQAKNKTILILEQGSLKKGEIAELVQETNVTLKTVASIKQALNYLETNDCALVIVDLGGRGIDDAVDNCQKLHELYPQHPILLYGQQSLKEEDEEQLRLYSDNIILKTPYAEQRMLENIERFLNEIPAERGQESLSSFPAKVTKQSLKLADRHILVVDDDPRNLFVITSALEQQGAKIDNATNGVKALKYLSENTVDLVFMDIMMPEMDGFEAIRQIKQNPALKQLPIVALTAKALRSDREKALAAGADDYLVKPVDYEVLINMAYVWCESRS